MTQEQVFEIDYSKQEEIKDALELAKHYCLSNIPITDSYSRQGLKNHLSKIENLIETIGNSFIVGNFK